MYWIKEQDSYASMFKTIKTLMEKGFDYVYRFRNEHLEYLVIFQRQLTADIQTLENAGEYKAPNEMFEKIVKINEELLSKLEANLVEYTELGLFQLRNEDFIKHFIEEQKNSITRLHRFVEKHLEKKEKEVKAFLDASMAKLSVPMITLDHYVKQRENLTELAAVLPELSDKLVLLNSLPQLLPPLKIPGLQQSIASTLVLGAQHSNLISSMENLTTNSTDRFKK